MRRIKYFLTFPLKKKQNPNSYPTNLIFSIIAYFKVTFGLDYILTLGILGGSEEVKR